MTVMSLNVPLALQTLTLMVQYLQKVKRQRFRLSHKGLLEKNKDYEKSKNFWMKSKEKGKLLSKRKKMNKVKGKKRSKMQLKTFLLSSLQIKGRVAEFGSHLEQVWVFYTTSHNMNAIRCTN